MLYFAIRCTRDEYNNRVEYRVGGQKRSIESAIKVLKNKGHTGYIVNTRNQCEATVTEKPGHGLAVTYG